MFSTREFAPAQDGPKYAAIGDYICLYSCRTRGYMYTDRTSCRQDGLYIFAQQDECNPENIANVHMLLFQICTQNRFKLNKKYRKQKDSDSRSSKTNLKSASLDVAKAAADSEHADNEAEQDRLHGRHIQYGDIIQLHHVFSNKYVHVDSQKTSQRDKNRLTIHLLPHDAKCAQFRIMPKYKIKSEGEKVGIGDHVVFESVKISGQYLHASNVYTDEDEERAEVNLGSDPSEFILHCNVQLPYLNKFPTNIFGGSVIQLHHKHLEAYLCAETRYELEERSFDETTKVYLWRRLVDPMSPATLYAPSSCSTFWQMEARYSILQGDSIKWNDHIRLRDMSTRLYLSVYREYDGSHTVKMIASSSDSSTVFQICPMSVEETALIKRGKCARFQHVISGMWLNGITEHLDGTYRHDPQSDQLQLSASEMMLYPDVFTLNFVEDKHIRDFNYISGIAPFFQWMAQRATDKSAIKNSQMRNMIATINELKEFIALDDKYSTRVALCRDMLIIQLMIHILREGVNCINIKIYQRLVHACYETLHVCVTSRSQVDCFYMASYLDFFLSQVALKQELGFQVTSILIALVTDRRQVVEKISGLQIDSFIALLRKYENPRHLELLGSLCVSDGVAVPVHQSRICEKLLKTKKKKVPTATLR